LWHPLWLLGDVEALASESVARRIGFPRHGRAAGHRAFVLAYAGPRRRGHGRSRSSCHGRRFRTVADRTVVWAPV